MAKLHHKLKNLNDYLRADLKLALDNAADEQSAVDLATATLAITLDSLSKGQKMRHLLVDTSQNHDDNHPYPLSVAVFVSKHQTMVDDDYLKIEDGIKHLAEHQSKAAKYLPLPRRKFWGIIN